MTQIERLKLKLPANMDLSDDVLGDCLESAKNVILTARLPSGDWPIDDEGNAVLEIRYLDLQVRIAVELAERQGGSTQTGHSENGMNRTWESAGISKSLLSEVTPFVAVCRR